MTATTFSYINDASIELKEVYLHITYLFLKELIIPSEVFSSAIVFLLALLRMSFFIHCRKWYEESFYRNRLRSHTAVSSAQVIYSFMPLFHRFVYFIVIANIFVSNRSLGTFFDGFCISFPDSMFRCAWVFFFENGAKIFRFHTCGRGLTNG